MKQTLFLSILLTFIFSGCFSVPSVQKISPFSKTKESNKTEIEIPSEAPQWLQTKKVKNHISSLGLTKKVDKKELKLHKRKAILGASHNLTRKIYVKTLEIFTQYSKKNPNNNVFEKEMKKFSEHVALKSLTYAKIKNTWISSDNRLFVQIAIDSELVLKKIQESSKLLFGVDRALYQNFLSNRASQDIIKKLEE